METSRENSERRGLCSCLGETANGFLHLFGLGNRLDDNNQQLEEDLGEEGPQGARGREIQSVIAVREIQSVIAQNQELESMASSSSSHQQNQEFNAFSGIVPAGKRRMGCESSRLFDVFINHRGPDVKETLATQLYDSLEQLGIRAFLDSREKELGTSFPSIIQTAIGSAKVHIAIFSKRYAESAWCLAELVLMLQSNAKIIPVFYEVEPWELRHIEKGGYADAFLNHEKKGRYLEKLNEWKEALQSLSLIAGEQVYSERDCQKIVEAVQKEVQRKTCLRVAEYPVGLNDLVEDFERRCLDELVQDFENHCGLEERKQKAKVVGIFGMGGSGKTTLAKELFNRKVLNYDKASFLFDVREASVRSQLPSLQLKLLKDLFDDHGLSFTSIEEGTSHLQDRLSRSPPLSFLIVLDDIDHVEQLNALLIMDILNKFGNTLVIATTRDVRVLITAEITDGYHLKGMNRNDGRQLFCWHAFGEPLPRSGYEALVEEFVDVCGGLPLSLQVLGRHVRGGTASYWRLELVKASKTLRQEVKERLRISFDALDGEQKQIFMDIACFFVGISKSIAERVWEGSGWNAQHALETLKDKCLVEEIECSDLNLLRMHDHLRDLGREMALELRPPHRLWRPQDLEYLKLAGFKTILSKTNIRCFNSIFDKSMGSRVTFFLSQSDSYLETSASLLWLQLEGNSEEQPSIPSWIPLQNLQCLKIHSAQLKTLWKNSIQSKSQLKELQINECTGIEELWLGHLRCLEKLTIKNCNHLRSVSGISNLAKLVELYFSDCEKLEFECLRLSGMKCLERVTFGRNVRVKYFELDGFQNLKTTEFSCEKLVELSIRGCPELMEIPDFKGPSCLERIIIDGCGKLEYLQLNGCHNLRSVSGSFEIRRLYISDCPELEESAYRATLSCMEEIEIKHCEKIQNIMLPTTLISLRVGSCRDLQSVAGTGDLTKLTKLYIFECPELEKLPNLAAASCMKEIEIKHCEKIQNIMLPTTPTTLISLCVHSCRDLQRVAGTGDLTKLKNLAINECPELEELPNLAAASCMEEIEIKHCEKIQNIMLPTTPTTLISLCVQSCRDLQRVAGTGDLTKLKNLAINECPELEELPNLAAASCMEEIEIKHCEKIQNIMLPTTPTTLISLCVQSCRDLQRVAGPGDLTKLENLAINECPELEELPSLSRQSFLTMIDINSCEKLQSISGIEELHILLSMRLNYCSNAVRRNCIHKLKGVPSLGMEMIGRAVNGAESILNEYLFSDANIGVVNALIDIGTPETRPEWLQWSAVIVCLIVVVDSSTTEESIKNTLPDLKVREGEWIITKVATTDNLIYNNWYFNIIFSPVMRRYAWYELISRFVRCGIVKKGYFVGVKEGEEWKSVDVLRTIVDRLYDS